MNFATGNENFAEVTESGSYYVDKTAYLKELFDTHQVKNPLFIRPRRFGKTLNLSMIKEFCELNYQNPEDKSYQQKLFVDNGRNLAVAGPEYAKLRDKVMGEVPVISIHGFMLGVLGPAASARGIEIESEPQSGDGYTDLILKRDRTAAILELKRGENTIKGRLKACQDAKAQILKRDYAGGLIAAGYTTVYGLGLGFGGKDCVMESLGNLADGN